MMVTFGQKVVVVSSVIIFLWLCVGTFMYRRYFQELPISRSHEQEVFYCNHGGQKLSPGFWKHINLQRMSIPESIKDSVLEIHVEPRSIEVQGSKVHYLHASPKETNGLYSVLLLHGQSFTSQTWNVVGTIRMLASLGYDPVAVDLPGYGESPSIPNLKKSSFLDDLIAALKMKKPVLISPSMSGSYSIKYLIEHPEKFGGYVAVAPVGTNLLNHSLCSAYDDGTVNYLNEDCRKLLPYLKSNDLKLNCIKVPTLVVWGELDRGENSAKLCLLPKSQGAEIPKGKHPAYLSNPDLWHKLLYNFLNVLNETQACRQNM